MFWIVFAVPIGICDYKLGLRAMVVKCAVGGCPSVWEKGRKVSFNGFPDQLVEYPRYMAWITFCGLQPVPLPEKDKRKVCGLHFEDQIGQTQSNLRGNAVPSKNSPSNSPAAPTQSRYSLTSPPNLSAGTFEVASTVGQAQGQSRARVSLLRPRAEKRKRPNEDEDDEQISRYIE